MENVIWPLWPNAKFGTLHLPNSLPMILRKKGGLNSWGHLLLMVLLLPCRNTLRLIVSPSICTYALLLFFLYLWVSQKYSKFFLTVEGKKEFIVSNKDGMSKFLPMYEKFMETWSFNFSHLCVFLHVSSCKNHNLPMGPKVCMKLCTHINLEKSSYVHLWIHLPMS